MLEYKEVPEWPGYLVGSDGTVLSNRWTKGWRPMKGGLDKDGYRKLILCNAGKKWYVRLHDLILRVFRGDPPAGHIGAHENGDKADNSIDNLAWKTQKENIADKVRHGTAQRGDKASRRILSEMDVREIRRKWSNREATQTQMAEEHGVSTATINAAIRRRNWRFCE
jgi:hypothetical protein